jgi:hypothetical protein
MQTIGLQQWNNVESGHQRRRSRGGRGRRQSAQYHDWERQPQAPQAPPAPINESTIMPPARATREVVHTLSQLQRLYIMQHQLDTARAQQHQRHVAELERDITDTHASVLNDAALKEQQELVNLHGMGPVSPARLRALTTQITTLHQRL